MRIADVRAEDPRLEVKVDAEDSASISGLDFVYFSPGPWEGLWRNRHQLMSVFSRTNRVLFVEGRLSLRPTLKRTRKLLGNPAEFLRPSLREVLPNLFVLSFPLWAPHSEFLRLDGITRRIRRAALARALRKLEISRPIVWYSLPSMNDLLEEIPSARLRVYHVVDEYSAYGDPPPEKRSRTEADERKLLAGVDLVVVVSPKLHETKGRLHPKTHLVPNGVDFDRFQRALADPAMPSVLEKIPSPRLGYAGLISDKLDFSMLRELAECRPDWSLVFIGEERVTRQAVTWEAMRRLPNVYSLGRVTVEEVPHYLKGLQAGLMPYRSSRHSEHISPLKLYDYLAAGLPVAAVDIPGVRDFKDHVRVAADPSGFLKACETALNDCNTTAREKRRAVAAVHTWESRVELLSEILQRHLSNSRRKAAS